TCLANALEIHSQIIVNLYSLDPEAGAIDIHSLNLTPITQTAGNLKRSLALYKYIAMMEIKTVAEMSVANRIDENICAHHIIIMAKNKIIQFY
ncbi:MAG: hypothetical protein ACTH64_18605, partial [Providencia sp.]